MSNGLKEIRKDAFKSGLILGLGLLLLDSIAFYILAYGSSLVAIGIAYVLCYLVIPLLFAIVLIKSLRGKIGGYWTQRQATSGIFIMFLCAHILSSLGNFLFVRYLQPQIIPQAKDNLIRVIGSFLAGVKTEAQKINEIILSIEQRFDLIAHETIGVLLSNLMFSIIVIFITALIFAAIFKREYLVHQPNQTVS
jgi:hypothetical protein